MAILRSEIKLTATKNYRELFAESFAFHMLKKSLPRSVSELMDRSLPIARNALIKGAEAEE